MTYDDWLMQPYDHPEQGKKIIGYCDHCGEVITADQDWSEFSGGAYTHRDCEQEYALEITDPIRHDAYE